MNGDNNTTNTSDTVSVLQNIVIAINNLAIALAPIGGGGFLSSTPIGYTTGAGGTITQLTSKTTAVTINHLSGQITMNGALLAGLATVAFIVNNTQFNAAGGDTVIANHISGGTAGAYDINVRSSGTNAFVLAVTNNTGGNLSETPVIGFNIFKGSIN